MKIKPWVLLLTLLTISPANRAEEKRAAPLWLRREHYEEEIGWAKVYKEPDPQDVEELAITIFCEAGADAQSDLTRYRVGDVVLTRVADSRFPDTLHEVLTQKRAYGRFFWTGVVWPKRASYKENLHAVERARKIAYNLLTDMEHSDLWGKGYIWQDDHERGKDNVWSDEICFGR